MAEIPQNSSSFIERSTSTNFEKHGCNQLHGVSEIFNMELYLPSPLYFSCTLSETMDLSLPELLTFRRLPFCLPLF